MSGTFDEADYLSAAPNGKPSGKPTQPVWMRLGLPIAGICALSGGIAAAVGLTTEKLYEGTARVELMTPEGVDMQAMPAGSVRAAAARTSTAAARAVVTLDLLNDPRFLASHQALDNETIPQDQKVSQAAAILLRGSASLADNDGTFATLTYRSPDPTLAADIATALAHSFVTQDAQRVAGALGDTREDLEELITQVRGELERAERSSTGDLSDAEILTLPAAQAELVTPDGNDTLTDGARGALTSELTIIRAQIDQVESDIVSGALDLDDPIIAQLQQSRSDTEAQYQRVTEQFRADYPGAQRLREEIEAIDASLEREALRLAADRASLQAQFSIREQEVLNQLDQLGSQVGVRVAAGVEAGVGAGAELGTLEEDIVAKRELYGLLLARLATVDEAERPATARVIEESTVPTRSVTPNWLLLLGIAAAVALLLSGALVWQNRKRPSKVSY